MKRNGYSLPENAGTPSLTGLFPHPGPQFIKKVSLFEEPAHVFFQMRLNEFFCVITTKQWN
ncbi:MAG: hypothetical protein Q8908_01660, partial [Bacteroidota bacterium]|nr:hypothetical protein [Bacteroidota bacterium]